MPVRPLRSLRAATCAVPALAAAALLAPPAGAQGAAPSASRAAASAAPRDTRPPRAIRRDVPITQAIRRALAAGSRDSTGRPTARYWQNRADYVIQARLDTATSRLTGRATITFRNGSPDSLAQLALRLDPNLFIGTNPHAAPWTPAEVTDGMVLTRLVVDGRSVNVTPEAQLQFQGANAANAAQAARDAQRAAEPTITGLRSTVARIRLPQKLAPGAATTLEIDWHHKLPGGPGAGHRMTQRWADTLYQPTQWYPRLAVYDDLRGWNAELYLGPSEFYNEFGRFDVTLDVPAGWLVSGTGTLQNAEQVLTPTARARLAAALGSDSVTTIVGADEAGVGRATQRPASGDRLQWRFVADSVNDFAWATARSFVWKATRATIPGRGAIPVHMLHLPGRARFFEQAGPITRHALEFYSKLWFPYPFPQLTLQDGPSAGMEYPMVINSNQGAADHETGHQWWPMVVSNNETWYGWMDEGFNQYMNVLSDADAEGKPAVLDGLGQSYGATAGGESEPPMMWNANYAGPASYGFTTYAKTPLMLSALGGIVGDSAVIQAHRAFANAWRFKHPSPWDWMFFMDRALGRDLGWFWNGWLFGTEGVDGAIADVRTTGRGATARTVVAVRQDGQMPSPVVLRVTLAGDLPASVRLPANAQRVDARTLVMTWPVDVWFDGRRTYDAALPALGGVGIATVTLDPQCRFPDRDATDNVWPKGSAAPGCAARR